MTREIKVLHLESTNVCQAACPLCARETDPLFDKRSNCLLYTSPSPRDMRRSRMPSSA